MCAYLYLTVEQDTQKGAVQQMEVEIAALYNTMHINLQWTEPSRVWS